MPPIREVVEGKLYLCGYFKGAGQFLNAFHLLFKQFVSSYYWFDCILHLYQSKGKPANG